MFMPRLDKLDRISNSKISNCICQQTSGHQFFDHHLFCQLRWILTQFVPLDLHECWNGLTVDFAFKKKGVSVISDWKNLLLLWLINNMLFHPVFLLLSVPVFLTVLSSCSCTIHIFSLSTLFFLSCSVHTVFPVLSLLNYSFLSDSPNCKKIQELHWIIAHHHPSQQHRWWSFQYSISCPMHRWKSVVKLFQLDNDISQKNKRYLSKKRQLVMIFEYNEKKPKGRSQKRYAHWQTLKNFSINLSFCMNNCSLVSSMRVREDLHRTWAIFVWDMT